MTNKIIVEVDMCCEVLFKGPSDKEIDLHFENGDVWSDPDFKKFGVKIHSASNGFNWPSVCLEGTENELRAYFEHYDWDNIDFIIEECRL